MRVGVIGGGIGGLCAAIGLARVGAEVVIHERARELAPVGSGLSIFANGAAALDAIGVGEQFRAIATTDAAQLRAGQRTPEGAWLATIPSEAVRDLRIVHRAELHVMLVDALPAHALRLGSTVVEVSDDGTRITSDDGAGPRNDGYDVVIAADGIRSAVRSSWHGDPGIRYSGYSTWRGVTSEPVDLLGAAGETWGRGLRFGLAPLSDGRVYWFAVASMPADRVIDDEFAEVRLRFGSWHAPIPDLLDATDPATVFRLPIDDLARPLPTFRRGACVLLGDAAHAMTPDLGQGGGQAMEDAATLAALLAPLASHSDPSPAALEAALAEYDRVRRARTQPLARRSRTVGAVAQARRRGAVALRDAVLRSTPSRALARQALAMQSWEPPPA